MTPDQIRNIEPKSFDEARELIDELVGLVRTQQKRIDDLDASLKEQLARAGKHSGNSDLPPSSDSTAQRGKRKKKSRSERGRGAQPGHDKHERRLFGRNELDAVHGHFPSERCDCGCEIELDGASVRHQVFDLPPIRAVVTEHQLHKGRCGGCGKRHVGTLPPGVPSGQMGPGLIALISVLSGQYHLSTRKIQRLLKEVFGTGFSLSAVSEAQGRAIDAMAAPYLDIGRHVRAQPVVNADETRHFRGDQLFWMWVLACPDAVWFVSHQSRGKDAADQLLGDTDATVVTDDYVGYDRVPAARRQLCWTHLLRHVRAVSERSGSARIVGEELVGVAETIFALRRQLNASLIYPGEWRKASEALRVRCRVALERGARLRLDGRTRAQCRRWLGREPMFWTHRVPQQCGSDWQGAVREVRKATSVMEEIVALRSLPAGAGFKPPRAALAEDRCRERRGKSRDQPGRYGSRRRAQANHCSGVET